MKFNVIGLNHETASIEMREKLAIAAELLPQSLLEVQSFESVEEVVIVSTCNRTEVYIATAAEVDADDAEHAGVIVDLSSWLCGKANVSKSQLRQCTYVYDHERSIRHLFRVAGGLDSLVLGEPQILGQLKSAYASARETGTISGGLAQLFEVAFSVAKRIRTETTIGENPVSVAAAAVELAKQLYADFSGLSAIVIGAGRTAELVVKHMQQHGTKRITIVNRTIETARQLSERVGGVPALLADLPDVLGDVDIVISSTASQLPILGKGSVERAMKKRRRRPYFMVDIAVPRDIEPEVGDLDDVYLYDIDDLKLVIDANLESREVAAKEADGIIDDQVRVFLESLKARHSVDTLKEFRQRIETVKEEELFRAQQALESGADVTEVLDTLARNLSNKVMHKPTVNVKRALSEGKEDAQMWLRYLFDLDD